MVTAIVVKHGSKTACFHLKMDPRADWRDHGSKTAHFHLKMDHRVAPRSGTRLIEHPFAIL